MRRDPRDLKQVKDLADVSVCGPLLPLLTDRATAPLVSCGRPRGHGVVPPVRHKRTIAEHVATTALSPSP